SKLQDHRDPLIVLRHRDSILLVLAVTTSIESCRIFLSSSDEEWGMTFILPFTIAYFTFAVPLQMCQLFLGQYGHKSLIKLWEIAPLFYDTRHCCMSLTLQIQKELPDKWLHF
ncbi:hypothetical protein C0J52_03151, partial [Blattella germanica]